MEGFKFKNFWRSVITVAAVGLLGLCAACASSSSSSKKSATVPIELRIVATEFKYEPNVLEVPAGVPVSLLIDNSRAATEHGLTLVEFGVRLEVRAGEVARKTVVFDRSGEYEFICDLPGHKEAGMKGKLLVKG
ncbi:cupredoxin domain-containing protein [Methylocaldum szegediense]|jgi:plastocyanin|uniref:EfeO-type cupredoxin-like domain-containing protein n=1 Tax=Methylocaldum szegediense TaxID=73780 RepID=A0ABN8X7V5_9GAMM|nr:cupredoxin domain-containing protein [Methylocaldum szegediense]CAI8879947.1 exported protein of unknown function [Methylocaldum szegediense]